MSMATTSRLWALAAPLFCGVMLNAQSTTYTYKGNNFTTTSGPYTTSDSITGYFTVSQPLAGNLSNADISSQIVTFAFSDGVYSWTPADSRVNTAAFSTNSSGAITLWSFNLIGTQAPLVGCGGSCFGLLQTTNNLPTTNGTSGNDLAGNFGLGAASNGYPGGPADPGTWTGSASTTSFVLYATTVGSYTQYPNSLVTVDPATGAQQLVGQPGQAAGVFWLTANPVNNMLYGTGVSNSGILDETTLYIINPASGAIAGRVTMSQNVSAVAASPQGTLYGLSGSTLGTINTTTGQFSSVGTVSLNPGYSLESMAFSPAGTLYGVTEEQSSASFDQQLITINPTSGAATVLGSLQSQLNVGDITYAPDGNIYGANFSYYLLKISPQSLSNTAVGNGVIGDLGGIASILTPASSGALEFVPVSPCRVADTRNPVGQFGGPELAGGVPRSFAIPAGGCGIPSTAKAYSLNVTVVPDAQLEYLTVWPSGLTQPLVSTLNSLDGRIKANAAIVPAGANGAVSVYAADPTHVILDINGYFAPAGTSTLAFYPLTPCRVADTRNAAGSLGGPFLRGGAFRAFPILSSSCSIPPTAAAYSLNLTAVPHGSLGYLTVWPTGESQPLVSTLNALTAAVTANAAIVPAGSGGEISVYPTNDTDLVIDVNGYFAPPATGGLSLYSLTPCRVLDTRTSTGAFTGTLPVNVAGSGCGVPATAQAYVLNATVVPAGPLGYLSLWPNGQSEPLVSTLNALDGAIASNMAIVPTMNGRIDAYAANLTYLILDIFGFFAP